MPTPGLSLVGFLQQQDAINLLRSTCVVADPSDAALTAEWQAARAKLGPPVPNAGRPGISNVPAAGQAHMAQLVQRPWIQAHLQGDMVGATFQLIELAPLLAMQFNVDIARSDHHNGGVSAPAPNVDDLFSMCLPLVPMIENVRTSAVPNAQNPNALLVTSRGLNFYPMAQGLMQNASGNFIGVQVGVTVPLMHVVRYNGRCYLHNGFHRGVGLLTRGVTHAPCVFRDVADFGAVGLMPNKTFDGAVLESGDPPTLAHFGQGRAYDVQLKIFTRTIHVSWADHVTTED
ncbi:hypothetical protein LJR084_000538 [Variovorax sp. LjRoot84]|uniref:hypothetical protein n=1 Tax=Variovorax sp. LjRoot84 TaxID=3342340 RepID=UPI003ECCDAC1